MSCGDKETFKNILSTPHKVDGKRLDCNIAFRKRSSNQIGDNESRKVFIGGVNNSITNRKINFIYFLKEDIQLYFCEFGNVLSAYVVKNFATGKSKGFGFVEYSDPDAAKRVIDIQYHIIKGVKVSCSFYLKRGKKYHREFKELEQKIKKEKGSVKKSKSFQFLDEIDTKKSQSSVIDMDMASNQYFRTRSQAGSSYYSKPDSFPQGNLGGFSSEGESFFNSNSVNSGNQYLAPPEIPHLPADMKAGMNLQEYYQPKKNIIMNNYVNKAKESTKRLSLEPYAMGGNQIKDFQLKNLKNRRSLFTNFQGGYKRQDLLPTITVNNCDEEPIQENSNDFPRSPTSSEYSANEHSLQMNQQNWGFYNGYAKKGENRYDRKFTIATQQTGDTLAGIPYDYPLITEEYQQKAREVIFNDKSQNGLSNSNISLEENVKNESLKKEFQLFPPPVIQTIGEEKETGRSFDLGDSDDEEEGGKGKKDDSFDENMLLKECFEF